MVDAYPNRSNRSKPPGAARGGAAWAILTLAAAAAATATDDDGKWSVKVASIVMEAHGHDQHVLNLHQIDLTTTPALESTTAVSLETDTGPAYRGELQYRSRGKWAWGLDFLWFNTGQNAPELTASGSGIGHPVVFEIADRSYTSSDPGEVLFYNRLEDTDLALWTVDLYAMRTLAETEGSGIRLLFGLRNADFDNDYRAVVGLQGIGGTRVDAASNYERMMGPLVGLRGEARIGKSTIEGYFGQSLLLGNAELSGMSRDFSGPFSDQPSFLVERTFHDEQDVAIPVTEARIKWTYRLSRHFAFGLGVDTAAWWDVPVPPGVLPVADGAQTLHENTLVLFGLLGTVELTF